MPAIVLLFVTALASASCTRHFYRERSDKQVDTVLSEKDWDPWKIEMFHVYPDPRARFADSTDPDHPPMPPDDPGAFELSPHPQKPGKAGVALVEGIGYLQLLAEWDAANRAAAAKDGKEQSKEALETLPKPTESKERTPPAPKAEAPPQQPTVPAPKSATPATPPPGGQTAPPTPKSATPSNQAVPGFASESCYSDGGVWPDLHPKRPYLINLEQAVELGTFNSREFQDRREDLYLTALPVVEQRFAFVAQFLAAEQAIREWSGSDSPQGLHNRWVFNSNVGASQLFPTGALLLLDFANQTVIDFSHFPKTISQSTAMLNLIQPLLRGGGFAVTLEPLTQSERALLYQVRNYARFRKEFFVSIAGGGGGSISGGAFVPSGIIITSTVNPNAGVSGSGITPGVIAPVPTTSVSPQLTPGQSGQLNLTKAIPPPSPPGYFGTLLQYAQIAIDQENIEALQRFLKLFAAFKEGGDISQLQVDQVEQQLVRGITQKLLDEQEYGTAIDQFHIQLGLPVDLPLELDDLAIRGITHQYRRYEQLFREYGDATQITSKYGAAEEAGQLRRRLRELIATAGLTAGTKFRTEFPARWSVWEKLGNDEISTRLRDMRQERQRLLDRQADLDREGKALAEAEQRRLALLDADLDLGAFEQTLREYESQPWRNEPNADRRRQQQTIAFRSVINVFDLLLGQARNERLQTLRTTWPALPPLVVDGVDILKADEEDAYAAGSQAALTNRLDLMNARAQLVDAWRQLAVFANALLGTVNLQYNMTSTTPMGQARPFALGGARYDHQLVINAEAPLVRVVEQSNYRASIIAYQRQRRALMEAEDLTNQTVRGEIRQLRQFAENYRLQQRLVELAYLTVENSLDIFQQPLATAGPQQNVQATGAALTQQLLNAQGQLPGAQNTLLSTWINYLNTRLSLYRDIELMPLDPRGVWIDDVATSQSSAGAAGHDRASQAGQSAGNACPAPTP